MANKYTIRNSLGQQVYHAKEGELQLSLKFVFVNNELNIQLSMMYVYLACFL